MGVDVSSELIEAIVEMREEEALRMVSAMLENGEDPQKVLAICQEAMGIVGSRYQAGEYFLPELMMSGEVLRKISEVIKPKLATANESGTKLGRVVIGTVRGDIHNTGKDMVTFLLNVNGFEVLDLGVDVPPRKFVEAVKDFRPQVVGLSGLLTLAYDSMKSTVDAIKEAGLRDDVKIMLGGAQITEMVRVYAGADAFGTDAIAAVTLSKKWLGV